MTAMITPVYQVSSQLRIHNTEDDWSFNFTADEYQTVTVAVEVKHGGYPKLQTFISQKTASNTSSMP